MARLRILHLGLGAFHRAHQAAYMQDLVAAGDDRWELAGGHIRPEKPDTGAVLVAQGGRYTVETVTPAGDRAYQRIDVLRAPVPYTPDLAALCTLASDPATRIISCPPVCCRRWPSPAIARCSTGCSGTPRVRMRWSTASRPARRLNCPRA